MALTIKAAGYLQQRMPDKRPQISLDCPLLPCTVAELIAGLGWRPDKVGIVRVNGQPVGTDHLLADGDQIELFPRIGGG